MSFSPGSAPIKHPDAIITIEVGHGPYPEDQCEKEGEARFDYGAIDRCSGAKEWTLNKVQAAACKKALDEKGYKDVLVLDSCDFLTSIGRKNRKSNVFVSIHHNAFRSDRAQGSEALCHKQYASSADEDLAKLCATYMALELGIVNRGVKYRGLGVLQGVTERRWKPTTAAVLTEAYFITGYDVNGRHTEWSTRGGHAIARAIHEYCQMIGQF